MSPVPERLKRSPGTNVSNARTALKRHSRGATPRAPLAWANGPGWRGRESLSRAIALLVIGLLLAGVLWFGLVPAAENLRAQGVPLATGLDPGVVDAVVFALNVALLIGVVVVRWSRRGGSSE